MKPVRLRKAAWVYGKAEGPFHPKGPAGGWCGMARENYGFFFPEIGLSVRLKILSIRIAARR